MNNTIKLIQYGSKEYLKVTPVKALHNSHMVKDVLSRGDSFAVDLETGELTIIKTAGVKAHYTTQYELHKIKPPVDVEAVREQLRVMAEQIRALSASIGE